MCQTLGTRNDDLVVPEEDGGGSSLTSGSKAHLLINEIITGT